MFANNLISLGGILSVTGAFLQSRAFKYKLSAALLTK